MDRVRLERLEKQLQVLLEEVRGALAPRRKLVRVIALLDKSASMHALTSDTIAGYNRFIREQVEDKSTETEVSLILFASPSNYRELYTNIPVGRVPELTEDVYIADGMSTALNDASHQAFSKYTRYPESINTDVAHVGVVITDGLENASKRYKKSDVVALMEQLKATGRFSFLFLGSHPDTWNEAESLGYAKLNSFQYSPTAAGLNDAYARVSRGLSNLKSSVSNGGPMASNSLLDPNSIGTVPDITGTIPTTAEGIE